ncbi:phosphatidylinositol-glycan biosynthesis class F protein isoform X2 [Latimeria chalumnae]|uniref:Phosphatidylinositol glycan anchor biosynthesis class F n=1 Tax=Latimeria chalumnae TaxID=7897 RepID=H3AN51_LATCH|nr:PREDICTED: phosphatidylinositol-glycan biosynthesis class F protein isoform X2 [Latimeria chalumnae]|eukprot:XP_006007557.1 PREDICTED: phosphatidylinositol-glycan biosynthesis class F protein isoform X2 [Latimeria chalumnae]
MKNIEIRGMVSVHFIILLSIVLATFVPPIFLDTFSVIGTHLTWICICSVCVAAANIVLYVLLETAPASKKNTNTHKVTRIFKSCKYFFISCLIYHGVLVLYGASLVESVLETFLFAVLLSTYTTLRCLCMLGPNVPAWIRVFSKNGAMSIWDNSLQITTASSVIGAWLGAFPIPLDWDRPWQAWPISCSLGATIGFVIGLLFAPLWIYWHRKHLTYKSR